VLHVHGSPSTTIFSRVFTPVFAAIQLTFTVLPDFCDSNAAMKSLWLAAASSGVAQGKGCFIFAPFASSSQNAAHRVGILNSERRERVFPAKSRLTQAQRVSLKF